MHDIKFSDIANKQHNPSKPSNEALVDVFIPVRNGVEYLSEAINSALNQTLSNFRLIVVNNNSTDGTSEIIRSFSDSRLEVITHDATLPLFENLNFCLSFVSAPFFCILHADDRMLPDYLEKMYSAINATPLADMAYCKVSVINELGHKISSVKYGIKNDIFLSHRGIVQKGSIYASFLNYLNFIIAPSVLFRRSILSKVGGFRTDLSFFGDLEYWQRGLKSGAVYLCVPQTLFEYRLHEKQETAKVTNNLNKYRETLMYFSESLGFFPTEKSNRLRYSPIIAQARVALVIVWDYMCSNGHEAVPFRAALAGYLIEAPILPKCNFIWWLLRYVAGMGATLRRAIGGFVILCVVLPILSWQVIKTRFSKNFA